MRISPTSSTRWRDARNAMTPRAHAFDRVDLVMAYGLGAGVADLVAWVRSVRAMDHKRLDYPTVNGRRRFALFPWTRRRGAQ